MSEESSEQEEDYSVTIDGNGIFEFEDKNVRSERLGLILKKLFHEHTMRTLKNKFNGKGIDDKVFISQLKDKSNAEEINREIIKIQEDYKTDIFGNNHEEYNSYLPNFAEFPDYFNDRNNQRVMELNGILNEQIKNELTNINTNIEYKNLLSKTIDKYGETIYKDGRIAAQSIDVLKSKTEKTLFWSVCGEGVFGMIADAAYADLMAFATERETMAQIRRELNKNGINMSSTNDEFSAASAFIALNAKEEVYIASKAGVEIGEYISKIEIPILLGNPNVKKISLINTTDEFLLNLQEIASHSSNVEEFKNNSKNLLDSNVKLLFERNGEINNIDEKTSEIVNQINNFTAEERTPIESLNDNLNEPIDEVNHEEESEQNERNKLQNMAKETIIGMTREELSSEDYKKDFIEIMDEFERNPNDINKKELIDTYIKKVYPNIKRNLIKDVDKTIAQGKLTNLKTKPNKLTPLALVRNWEKKNAKERNTEITEMNKRLEQSK